MSKLQGSKFLTSLSEEQRGRSSAEPAASYRGPLPSPVTAHFISAIYILLTFCYWAPSKQPLSRLCD